MAAVGSRRSVSPIDDVEVLVDLDGQADGIGKSEQLLRRLLRDDAHVVRGVAVAVFDESAAIHAQMVQVEVLGRAADQPHLGGVLAEPHFALDLAHRHGLLNHRDIGDDALVVVPQHAVGNEQRIAQLGGRLSRLDAPHDDVVRTQILDLLLRLVADPFAHGHQPDHGRDADQDAQDGQARPELVQQEAVDAQTQCQEDASEQVAIPA